MGHRGDKDETKGGGKGADLCVRRWERLYEGRLRDNSGAVVGDPGELLLEAALTKRIEQPIAIEKRKGIES